jgi:hypothetical protein
MNGALIVGPGFQPAAGLLPGATCHGIVRQDRIPRPTGIGSRPGRTDSSLAGLRRAEARRQGRSPDPTEAA